MDVRGGSSPLSQVDQDEGNHASTPSKFSIDNLVSSENTISVASPAPSNGVSGSSPQKNHPRDDQNGSANGPRKRQRTSDVSKKAVNGSSAPNNSHHTIPPNEEPGPTSDGGEDDNEGPDGQGGEDEDEEGGEEDDDEEGEKEEDDDEEDEDEDEDEDDDDEDDDASTGSRDLEAPNRKDEAGEAGDDDDDDDVVMVDAPSKKAANGDEGSGAPDRASAPAADGDAANGDVPKKATKVIKRRKQREPSMDVSLPKGPPSLPTVRISLKCRPRDHGDYLNNVPEEIHQVLKSQNHPWAKWYEERKDAGGKQTSSAAAGPSSSPTLPEGLGDLGPFAHLLAKYPVDAPNGKTRRKRKKRQEKEEYDVTDPFVDDSELQIDEPTHSARPASKGFYVVLGDVELEKVGKGKRGGKGAAGSSTPNAGPSGSGRGGAAGPAPPSYLISGTQLEVSNRLIHLRATERGLSTQPSIPPEEIPDDSLGLVGSGQVISGSRESPIEVKDDAAAVAGKKKTYPARPVDRRLAAELEHLKQLVAQESFQVKARFPPSLRPPLRKAARLALELGEYTDNFFNYLPQLFPYNRFTMSKLVKREFFEDHVAMIKEKQDELFDDLRRAIEEALPEHRADYDEACKQWKAAGGKVSADGKKAAPSRENSTDADKAGDPAEDDAKEESSTTNKAGTGPGSEPIRKWKWTERMREDVFQIILIENGITELRIEKSKLENSSEQISELVQRKAAYKRLNDLWPEGEEWTTTTGISREHAIQKKKHDRHNNALAEQAAG